MVRRRRRPGPGRPTRARRSIVLAVLVATACADAGTPDDGASLGSPSAEVTTTSPGVDPERATLRVAILDDPRTLHPRDVLDPAGELVVRAIFDGLVDGAPDGRVVPAAAAEWSVEDEGLTYRFRLRPDRFHDGSPVTAATHAESFAAVLDPDRAPYFREGLLATLAEVEVVADDELVLRLVRPDPLLLHRLADPVLVPLPRAASIDPDGFARQPIGNGPFRMLGPREPGAFIRLGAWSEHPQPPRIDELVLQVTSDDLDGSRRWEDLLAGRVQIAPVSVDRRELARERFGRPLDGRRGSGLHESPLMATYAFGFAVDVPPFDDVLLRRAVSAAIDREALARSLATAGAVPATSVLPPDAGGAPPDCGHCRQDPDLARALVEEWRAGRPGTPDPILTVTYPRGPGHVTVAERVASDVEQVLGLEVRLQARDLGSLVRLVEERRAPFFRLGLSPSLGGEAASISLLADAFGSGGQENRVGWSDADTDRLLGGWSRGSPPGIARAVEQRILDAAVVVPLLWTLPDLVVTSEVGGFHLDMTGRWWPELVHLR